MRKSIVAAMLVASGIGGQAMAYDAGDVIVRAGAALVDPHGDGALDGALDVEDNVQLGLTATYMATGNIGVALLAATPFEHDITLNGDKIGSTKHLPPTVTVQYHFDVNENFHPYVGAGFNYTTFFQEESDLGKLHLDDSFGLAAEAGFDYAFNGNWGLNVAVWYVDIDTDAELDGAKLDTVEIDPWVYMIGVSYKF